MSEQWLDRFELNRFEFKGRESILVCPDKAEEKRRWMLKTEYFGAFPALEARLLEAGWHLAYLKNRTRWGTNDDLDLKREFAEYLSKNYGLSDKCVPIGMSCGGLHAIKQAARHPDMVSCLYLDAPVVNILSYPFGFNVQTEPNDLVRREALGALGLSLRELLSYRDHPLDHIHTLIEKRIPACLVWGDSDDTVPFDENGILVKQAYESSDVPFLAQAKAGIKHHPHGPKDMEQALEFIMQF